MNHRVFVPIVLIVSLIGGSARAASQERTLASLTSELRNAIVARDHAALDRLMNANFVLEAPGLGEKVPLKIWLDNTYHYLKLSSFDQTGVSAHVSRPAGAILFPRLRT